LIRKIGNIDSLDENLAFNFPSDIAMDAVGNIYILDSDNHRIQNSIQMEHMELHLAVEAKDRESLIIQIPWISMPWSFFCFGFKSKNGSKH